MEWTDELIQRLRVFWAEGLSTAEIGRRLGVSKNAVVGKAHRLDLTARPSPIRWEGASETSRRRNRRPTDVPKPDGPTLPPLSSASPLSPQVAAPPAPAPAAPVRAVTAPPPVAAAASVPAAPHPPSAPAQPAAVPQAAAPTPTAPPPAVRPAAPAVPAPSASAPPAPPQPRLQAVTARPYGRVITCCWPLGEPGTKSFRFCDAASIPGKPYCGEHAQLAYVKVRDRREDAA